jgi:hypothetical protein
MTSHIILKLKFQCTIFILHFQVKNNKYDINVGGGSISLSSDSSFLIGDDVSVTTQIDHLNVDMSGLSQ